MKKKLHAIGISTAEELTMLGSKETGSPVAMLEYRLVPLMMAVVKIGNELSAAALTRGLGNTGQRTNIYKIGFTVWDAVFALVATVATVAFILL